MFGNIKEKEEIKVTDKQTEEELVSYYTFVNPDAAPYKTGVHFRRQHLIKTQNYSEIIKKAQEEGAKKRLVVWQQQEEARKAKSMVRKVKNLFLKALNYVTKGKV